MQCKISPWNESRKERHVRESKDSIRALRQSAKDSYLCYGEPSAMRGCREAARVCACVCVWGGYIIG